MNHEPWIDYARPTALDADENYQVEIRLTAPHRDLTYTRAFWGNVGLGTPWRHSPSWRNPAGLSNNERSKISRQGLSLPAEPDDAHQPIVRTFRSVSRSWHPRRSQWIVDAVADDGTAWCGYSINDAKQVMIWGPLLALPQPDQPGA